MARIARAEAPTVGTTPIRGRRRPGWAWRSGIAMVTAAAVVVGGLILADGLGTETPQSPAAPRSGPMAIELAAVHAAAQKFTAPRPDQWTYVELKMANSGKVTASKGHQRYVTSQTWVRADGKRAAVIDKGKLVVYGGEAIGRVFPPQDYRTLAGLPTDPKRLLNWLRTNQSVADTADQQNQSVAGTADQQNQSAFNAIATILRGNLLPPAVTASLLRAAALIPGVVQSSTPVLVAGRKTTAVGRVTEGWLRSDILIDPVTHEFVGSRDIAIADHTFTTGDERTSNAGGKGDRAKGGSPSAQSPNRDGETIHIAKGEIQSMLARTTIRIVDAAGETS